MSARGTISDVLSLVSAVAAAREDATAEQLAELQDHLVPQLRHLAHDVDRIDTCRRILTRVMGPTWTPAGQWARAATDATTLIDDGLRTRGLDPDQVFAHRP